MKWTHKYPRVTGWWFVGQPFGKSFVHYIVTVRERVHKMQWSFLGKPEWNDCANYPEYWWAGPIKSPSHRHLIK